MPTYAALDGTRLYYEESGTGRTLVVLSGGGGRHPSYLRDLAGLPGHRITPHLRGVGESTVPPLPYWEQAHDVEALRTHLGLEKLDVVAHSAGTRLAMAHAAQYPDSVASMLLITPPSAHLTDAEQDQDEIAAARADDHTFQAAVKAMERQPRTQEEFDEWLLEVAPAMYAAWTPREQAHATEGRTLLETVRTFLGVTLPTDFTERLGRTRARVRIIAGAKDYSTGLAPVLAAATLFTDSDTVVIDDCGHYPWVEQPEAFRRAADGFLTQDA